MDKKYWFIISSLLIGCSDSSSEGDTNSEHDFSGLWQETTVLGEPFNITTKSQFILVDYGKNVLLESCSGLKPPINGVKSETAIEFEEQSKYEITDNKHIYIEDLTNPVLMVSAVNISNQSEFSSGYLKLEIPGFIDIQTSENVCAYESIHFKPAMETITDLGPRIEIGVPYQNDRIVVSINLPQQRQVGKFVRDTDDYEKKSSVSFSSTVFDNMFGDAILMGYERELSSEAYVEITRYDENLVSGSFNVKVFGSGGQIARGEFSVTF